METTARPGTPLRHRMLDDMRMRKFAEHTQTGYIRAVRKLAAFLGRSPDTATAEVLRRFPTAPGRRWHRPDDDQRDHLRARAGVARALADGDLHRG